MSDIHTDDKAAQPRLVRYPHPSGDATRDDYPVVQFPSPNEMSEEDFERAINAAWPQLLTEHVSKMYPPEKPHGYVDELVRHLLSGDIEQAQQRAKAWHDARHSSK
jgi:hypothetical protein